MGSPRSRGRRALTSAAVHELLQMIRSESRRAARRRGRTHPLRRARANSAPWQLATTGAPPRPPGRRRDRPVRERPVRVDHVEPLSRACQLRRRERPQGRHTGRPGAGSTGCRACSGAPCSWVKHLPGLGGVAEPADRDAVDRVRRLAPRYDGARTVTSWPRLTRCLTDSRSQGTA